LKPWLLTNFFKKSSFQNTSKTVSDIDKMYIIKFGGLAIYKKLFGELILISPTGFEMQGFEIS